MRPQLLSLAAALLAGCSAATNPATVPDAPAAPSAPPSIAAGDSSLPPQACTPEGYEAFFEEFVRTPEARVSRSLPRVDVAAFDVALRDYSWVLASSPSTTLDIEETRTDRSFAVVTRPVELDENDEIVRTLGPARTYQFKFEAGCWRYAGADA